jgi:hypothetical protein
MRKQQPLLLSLSLMLLGTVASGADNRPRTTVTLDPPVQSLLPGVPFDLTVTYTNSSDQRVAVGAIATVIITPRGGQPVRMKSHTGVMPESGYEAVANFELEPGQSASGVLQWSANWLFEDAMVTVPGTYEIALELTGNPNQVDGESTVFIPSLRSSAAELTRVQPVGEDALVWSRLQEVTNGRWPSHGFGSRATVDDAISDEVVAKFPRSGYYPYALLLRHARPIFDLQAVREAIGNFRSSPAYPHLLVAAAVEALRQARLASNAKRPVAEIELYMSFAKFYSDEALHTQSVPIRANARATARAAEVELGELRKNVRQK